MAAAHPIEVFYWTTPNGWKATIMLEECGLPYAVRPVNISKDEQFKPDFLRISPNNKIPAIIDPDGPDGQPIAIFESGAILQYLGRKTGCLYPAAERERVEVDQWLFWQVGGFGPMLGQNHHFRIFAPEKVPYAIERFTKEACPALRRDGQASRGSRIPRRRVLDRRHSLQSGGRSCGSGRGQAIDDFPHVKRWLERCWRAPPSARAGVKAEAS
jgi:GST-like protein